MHLIIYTSGSSMDMYSTVGRVQLWFAMVIYMGTVVLTRDRTVANLAFVIDKSIRMYLICLNSIIDHFILIDVLISL